MDSPASPASAKAPSSAMPLEPAAPETKSQPHFPPEYTQTSSDTASIEQNEESDQSTDEDAYMYYLTQNWNQKVVIPFDRFLPHLLRVSINADAPYFNADNAPPQVRDLWDNKYSSDWNKYAPMQNTDLADSIAQEPEYKWLKEIYRESQSEQDHYKPFANLVNYIISRLREHRLGGKAKAMDEADADKLMLVPAYRNSVQESSGKLYPDLLAIRKRNEVKVEANGRLYDRTTLEGQKAYPFSWHEPVFFVETMKTSTPTKETDPTKTPTSLKDTSPIIPVRIPPQGPNFKKRKRTESQETDSKPKKPKQEPVFSKSPDSASGPPSCHGSQHMISKSSASCTLEDGVTQATQDGLDYQIRCTKYALNMLLHGGLRTFVYGLLLQGSSLQVASYQRSSIIVTNSFHFLDQDRQFIGLLEGLERLTDSQFGFGDLLVTPNTESKKLAMNDWRRLVGATLKLSDDKKLEKPVRITVSKVLCYKRAVLRRDSFVVAGEVVEHLPPAWENALGSESPVKSQDADSTAAKTVTPPKIVIVKASTVPLDREPEARFIEVVREGARADPRKKWLLERLPEVLFWQQATELDEHEIRSAFALNEDEPKYELCTLRVLVFVPLEPITKIKNPVQLLRVYIDLIEAHKSLVKDFKVLHQDISLNNMMCRIQVDEKGVVRIVGVINDLDLAVFIVDGQGTSPHRQRTGTQPFMADELLKGSPVRHYPRHDLESFYYILLHHCTHYDLDPETGGIVQVANPPYADWARLSFEALYNARCSFWRENNFVQTSLHFRSVFFKPILQFQQLIKEGTDGFARFLTRQCSAVLFGDLDLKNVSKAAEEFNLKTWDGMLTHDKVISILKEGLVEAMNGYKTTDPSDKTIRVVGAGQEADFGDGNSQWECDSDEDKIILRNLIAIKAHGPIPS